MFLAAPGTRFLVLCPKSRHNRLHILEQFLVEFKAALMLLELDLFEGTVWSLRMQLSMCKGTASLPRILASAQWSDIG